MKVTVLKGGFSSEREVSLKTGAAVAAALRARGHEVREVDVTCDFVDFGPLEGADVVFIALHGKFGEDGQLQEMLDRRQIPYTGSTAAASATAMDKQAAKERFAAAGVRTPSGAVLKADSPRATAKAARAIAAALDYPVVVKPCCEGSSVGVSIHTGPRTIARGVAEAFKHGDRVMIERYVPGRELTVGIFEGRPLPAIELKPAQEFFSYDAKYRDGRTEYVVTADPRAEAEAMKAHAALGCDGFSRVDLRITEDGTPYVLEVNTIPGLTERSLLPKAAKAAGIDFEELCDRIVRNALKK